MTCTYCSCELKKKTYTVQYSIYLKVRFKKKKKRIDLFQRKHEVDYCHACRERMKAENIDRRGKKQWVAYMRRNPLYFMGLGLGNDIKAAAEVVCE